MGFLSNRKYFLASIFVLIVGGVALGWLLWNQGYLNFGTSKVATTTPTKTDLQPLTLKITEPEDGYTSDSKLVSIKGAVSRQSTIMVYGGASDEIVESDGGSFNINYSLNEGENEITITASDQDGDEKSETLNIFYLSEILD
ncbi:MAG: hypothetical protein A2Y57_04320 [Candidatus Woykebacteria bacterium RBG_13_40_7b]|uniref:Bacterial Ig-like domain-containing protein n=1 Tax=Candidatus Woykebacteria bacterium RBG_13_40_7b TaxID=1802594 RepID=A0A1G1W8C8_9BACT|nr:MAG: hypothetical protein A2Y57_04320 [Candidatus Woykebacteria bacterium RBG_13_40_7b]